MTESTVIYLDNSATTRVDPHVIDAMTPFFTTDYGNAASESHLFGRRRRMAVDDARSQIAHAVGAASPDEIVFTSGATESINLALKGIAAAQWRRGAPPHIVTAQTEHKAVLDSCRSLERQGVEVTRLPVAPDGVVCPDDVGAALTDRTVLVSIMAANNETGVLADLSSIASVCTARGVPLHTDATQAMGKIPFDIGKLGVSLASFSAHKFYGAQRDRCRMALPLALFARPARTGAPPRGAPGLLGGVRRFPTAASELALAVRPALV